jgi:hypothetical protein
MNNLSELYASGNSCGVNDDGIKNLNLEILEADSNPKITNVNHMRNLSELDASNNSGIDDFGIKKINLKKLKAYNNANISNKKKYY